MVILNKIFKDVEIPDTLKNGGFSNVNMLTEKGLYRLLYTTKSEIGKQFIYKRIIILFRYYIAYNILTYGI